MPAGASLRLSTASPPLLNTAWCTPIGERESTARHDVCGHAEKRHQFAFRPRGSERAFALFHTLDIAEGRA
jgi:hypothetical protein